jgi:hypothetical protein
MKAHDMKTIALLAFVTLSYISFAQEMLPGKRAHHSIIYDAKLSRVILTGGSTPLNGGSSFIFYDDTWAFDGKRWEKQDVTSDQRSGAALAQEMPKGKVYSIGGFRNNISLADVRVLNKKGWSTVSTLPLPGITEAGVVYDSKRKVFVLFGGSISGGGVNNNTWEWDGEKWKKIESENPPGRQAFTMVYDEHRKVTVVFGGMGATPKEIFGDTWEYDGKTWKKVSDGGPGARMAMGFTYDSKRGMLIIFGGSSANGILGDTWGWDGKDWKQLSTSGPQPRMMGYLAYDRLRDRVVMFGGRRGWPNDANDTWEWDGSMWTEIK